MRKIILLSVLYFLMYSNASALPLLGTVPFVFEIGVLLYAGISFLFSSIILFLLKYYKILLGVIFLFNILSIGFLYYFFSFGQLKLTKIAFTFGDIRIIDFYIGGAIMCTVFFLTCFVLSEKILKLKRSVYGVSVLFGILLGVIHTSIVVDSILLDKKFNALVTLFSENIDGDISFESKKIRNNIFISQDLLYYDNGIEGKCRLTVSYYIHTGGRYQSTAQKSNEIQLMTGLDNGECRDIITSIISSDF